MHYVDAMLCAVPTANKETYLAHAEKAADAFERHGALAVAECWGADVPEGRTNSLHTAVMRRPDETVVFSWIVWPSKAVRDEAWQRITDDPMFSQQQMPFDGQRLIYGGFDAVLER